MYGDDDIPMCETFPFSFQLKPDPYFVYFYISVRAYTVRLSEFSFNKKTEDLQVYILSIKGINFTEKSEM